MPRDVMRSCDSDLTRLKHDDILVEVKSCLAISILWGKPSGNNKQCVRTVRK